MNRWYCKTLFTEKSNKNYFLFGSRCYHAWYKLISYWLHEKEACCSFGVDLWEQLDHIFLSYPTEGIPYSSSDLLSFSRLPSTWTNYSTSNWFPPFYLHEKNYSKSKSSSLFASDKIILSQKCPSLCFSWIENSKSNSNFTKLFAVQVSFWSRKIPFFRTHSILLPLETKQRPLTPASVLAFADSVEELRFWSKSES